MVVFCNLMLYFDRVGNLWGLYAKIGSSWGKKLITPNFYKLGITRSILIYKYLKALINAIIKSV
jgi:hypothetical protein